MTLPPLNISDLLKQYQVRLKKSLGQNFLVDHNALLKIVRAAEIDSTDAVLEIGAGLGNLTRILASQAASVSAVEIDDQLFPILEEVTNSFNNFHVI
ncbi:MAG: rRNA adenine N-6-methyltransferase family protein, partial [Anaerolineales bacterium]